MLCLDGGLESKSTRESGLMAKGTTVGENQFSIPAALRTHKSAFSGRTRRRESSSADIMMEWDTNSNKYIMGGLFHRSDGKNTESNRLIPAMSSENKRNSSCSLSLNSIRGSFDRSRHFNGPSWEDHFGFRMKNTTNGQCWWIIEWCLSREISYFNAEFAFFDGYG